MQKSSRTSSLAAANPLRRLMSCPSLQSMRCNPPELLSMRSPRFAPSENAHRIQIWLQRGRMRVSVAVGIDRKCEPFAPLWGGKPVGTSRGEINSPWWQQTRTIVRGQCHCAGILKYTHHRKRKPRSTRTLARWSKETRLVQAHTESQVGEEDGGDGG